MNNDAGITNSCSSNNSSFNTTEAGMWENERKVREMNASDSSGASDAASLSLQLDPSTRNYLPQFIVRRFGDNLPIATESCQLKSKFRAKTGIIQHRYTVSWIEEDGPIHQEIEKMSLSSSASRSPPTDGEKKKKTTKNDVNNNNAGGAGAGGEGPKVSKTPKRKCCKPSSSSGRAAPGSSPAATDESQKARERREAIAAYSQFFNSGATAKKDISDISLKSEHSKVSPSHELMVEIGPKKYLPNVRKCDGPCAEMRDVADLRVLGRCDHAICSYCIINAPMISADDGSMGCCNKRCFAVDLVNQIPDPQRRHELYKKIFNNKNAKFEEIFKLYKGDIRRVNMDRKDLNSQYSTCTSMATSSNSSLNTTSLSTTNPSSLYQSMDALSAAGTSGTETTKSSGKYDLPPRHSSTSESSHSDPCGSERENEKDVKPFAEEILMLRLVILESSYFSTIKRHRFEEELEARIPLMAAIESLMGVSAGRNLLNSTTRMYYCPEDFMDTESMLEMNAKEHGILTMGELSTQRGKINIIIDYTGKLIKDKRRPLLKKESLKNGGAKK